MKGDKHEQKTKNQKYNNATYPPPGGAPGGGPYEGAYPGLLNSGPLQIIQPTCPAAWDELSEFKSDIWTRKKDLRRRESKSTVHAVHRTQMSVSHHRKDLNTGTKEERNAPLRRRRRTSLRPTVLMLVLVMLVMLLLPWIIIPHRRCLLAVRSSQE